MLPVAMLPAFPVLELLIAPVFAVALGLAEPAFADPAFDEPALDDPEALAGDPASADPLLLMD